MNMLIINETSFYNLLFEVPRTVFFIAYNLDLATPSNGFRSLCFQFAFKKMFAFCVSPLILIKFLKRIN